MNVSLSKNQQDYVKGLVEQGRYNSASEVVRTGLRLLEEKERVDEQKLRELKRLIQEGIDSGPAVLMTEAELRGMIEDHARTLRQEVQDGKRADPRKATSASE